jgi:hypothetical protein
MQWDDGFAVAIAALLMIGIVACGILTSGLFAWWEKAKPGAAHGSARSDPQEMAGRCSTPHRKWLQGLAGARLTRSIGCGLSAVVASICPAVPADP